MAMFIHLAPESRLGPIRRNGISRSRRFFGPFTGGVFAVPVTRNFYVSHQWLRELKRGGGATMVGVYFRVPDDERVFIGHYSRSHRWVTAAEAVAEFMNSEDREGWEVIIPRRIEAKEIRRVKQLPQVLGWRFFPGAKGKPPRCPCKHCTRGEYGARGLRVRLGRPA